MAVIAGYPYTLTLAGKEYPILAEGFELTMCVGAEGRHRTSSCNVSIRGTEPLHLLLTSTDTLLDAVVKDDKGETIFTGVVRPRASATVSQRLLDSIELEIMDYTERLHTRVYEAPDKEADRIEGIVYTESLNGLKVCDPADQGNSLVHRICALAGIDVAQAPTISTSVMRCSLQHGDYLDDRLASLLYEYMHDYRFDASGQLIVYRTGPQYGDDGEVTEDVPSSGRVVESLRGTLSVTRSDDVKDGVVVSYPQYETQDDVAIWSDSGGGVSIIFDYQSSWWVEHGRDVTWNLSALGDKARDVILSNWWIGYENQSRWAANTWCNSKSVTNCTQEGGRVAWDAGAVGGIGGQPRGKITVYADAAYLIDKMGTYGIQGSNSEDYTATCISNLPEAIALAYAIYARAKAAGTTYSFQSFEVLEPGDVVTLKESSVTGITARVRILSRKQSDTTGLLEYEAEGYGAISVSKPAFGEEAELPPQERPDFMLLEVSEDTIVADPETDLIPVIASASGIIFDKYGGVPSWSINGANQPDLQGQVVEIDKSRFTYGSNRLSVSAEYDGETYRIDYIIRNLTAKLEVSVQYTITDEGKSPDPSSVWTDGQPNPGEGQVVWTRFRTSADAEWIVLRVTPKDGEQGPPGENPVVYFQWAATPYVRPDEGYDIMAWSETVPILWESEEGSLMGFITDGGEWETMVPEKPQDLNYLWVRYYNYQTSQWDYFCTTGTPAMSFDLDVSPQTFKLTSRGCVQEDKSQSDGGQRIVATVTKVNTSAPVTWTVDSEFVSWEYATDYSDAEIVITIPTHTEAGDPLALQSFSIKASIADIEVSKSCQITGVQEGKAEMTYLGIYDSLEELSQVTAVTEGALMVGDHAVVEGEDGKRRPYYYDGEKWVFADGNTPVSIAGKVMMDCLYDALHSSATVDTMSVIDLFVANLAANNIFANYAELTKLIAGPGDGTAGSGLRVRIGNLGEGGAPIFDVMWGTNTVFSVDPATGNIFFGEPSSDLSGTESGVMYNPTLRSLVGPGFQLDSLGMLYLERSHIRNTLSLPAAMEAWAKTNYKFFSFSETMLDEIESWVRLEGDFGLMQIDKMYLPCQCSSFFDKKIWYVKIHLDGGNIGLDFYTGSLTKIVDSEFGTSRIAKGTCPHTLYSDGSGNNLAYFSSPGSMLIARHGSVTLNLPREDSSTDPVDHLGYGEIYIDKDGVVRAFFNDEASGEGLRNFT